MSSASQQQSQPPAPPVAPKLTTSQILSKAANRALGGGLSGAAAMGINVGCLMWLRTTVNYQYRHGTNMSIALSTLYKEGGIPRFYQGLLPALVQGPMSRFGDTAANTGVLALLDSYDETRNMNPFLKTACASTTSALWRIFLMPIDTLKTYKQVNGAEGWKILGQKVRTNGIGVMYHGSLAAFGANLLGHYPWFGTYNFLQASIPKQDDFRMKLVRNAFIGFCSSFVSDCTSNSVRVVKVYKQANTENISYPTAVKRVIAEDGLAGLFGRGLSTKILSNGLQGIMFSVLWKLIDDAFFNKDDQKK